MRKKIILALAFILLIYPFNIKSYAIRIDQKEESNLGVDSFSDKEEKSNLVQMSNINDNTFNNIVILIRFNGENEFLDNNNSNELFNVYNEFLDNDNDSIADPESISLKSYINDLTYGEINVKSVFYPTDGNKYFSIEAPNPRSYYENYYAGSKTESDLIKWAFEAVKKQINLSSNELDKNNDNEIDMVTFLVSGETANNKSMLWPHETKFTGDSSINGKYLSTYNLIQLGNNESNIFNKGNLKIAIHEFLHAFGYPDLYRYYLRGNPVGEWDVMANTDGHGQMPLVYTRNKYSNLNLNIPEINQDGTYKLKSAESAARNEVQAFKIKSPLSDNEYFMVEFRKKEGNWDIALPGSGLIVYRINDNVDSYIGNRNGYPDHIYVFRQGDLNNSSAQGETKTAFLSMESGRTSFGSSKINKGFIENSLFFDNGENSGIVISEVGSASTDEISFKVTYPKENQDISFKQIIGRDRYDTAAKLSSESFTKSDTIVIANGLELADGLSATPLASYINAPILLVSRDVITIETLSEIKRLGTRNAIIVGGEGVVSSKIDEELKSSGITNITRIGGIDRYETSLKIAKYIDKNYYNIENIVVCNGYAEADSMSIASIAGKNRMPILLSETTKLNSNVSNWIKEKNINNAYLIGGDGVLTNNVLNEVNNLVRLDIRNNRLGGKDRYETNARVLSEFNDGNIDKIYLAKGITLVDALSAAPIAAINNGVVVLCDNNLSLIQKNILNNINFNEVIEAGGGISPNLVEELKILR